LSAAPKGTLGGKSLTQLWPNHRGKLSHPKENDKESTKEFPHVNHSPYAYLALLLTGHGADSDENEHDHEDNAADPKIKKKNSP